MLGNSSRPPRKGTTRRTREQTLDSALDPRVFQLSLAVVERPIGSLQINPRNARTHGKKQINQIAASIKEFGFTNPVLVNEIGMVIAGHGRVAAADMLGMTVVPTIELSHMTPDQLRAYVLADNRLAELAGWDKDILSIELGELIELDLDFDIEITGFATVDIDKLMSPAEAPIADPADAFPEPAEQAISRVGDLWEMGPHRLLCGNALDPGCYAMLMAGELAQMVFTDPPYNVPIAGHVSGMGRAQHREFVMATGEMSSKGFTAFLINFLGASASYCTDGAIMFVCMDSQCQQMIFADTRSDIEVEGGEGLPGRQTGLIAVPLDASGCTVSNLDLQQRCQQPGGGPVISIGNFGDTLPVPRDAGQAQRRQQGGEHRGVGGHGSNSPPSTDEAPVPIKGSRSL